MELNFRHQEILYTRGLTMCLCVNINEIAAYVETIMNLVYVQSAALPICELNMLEYQVFMRIIE